MHLITFLFNVHKYIAVAQLLFSTEVELKEHLATIHVSTTRTTTVYYQLLHECTLCKQAFEEPNSLKEHEKTEHYVDQKYVWQEEPDKTRDSTEQTCCIFEEHESAKQFTEQKYLCKEVVKTNNSTEQKYVCKECGNMFGGHAQLSAHKRLHKERPFKCDQCDKAYPRKVELEIHLRSHTGELPYPCHLCNKRFAIKVRLTYHLQKHEGVNHSCHYCDAVYDNRNKLKAHLFKHTGMPYKCELCPGLGFERRLRFANHMQRFHQRILTEDELAEVFAKNTGKTVRFKPAEGHTH